MKIAPSIMCANLLALGDELAAIAAAGADALHLDIMDGHFVPGFTFGVDLVRQVCDFSDLPVDVHLMSDIPLIHMEPFLNSGADLLIIHAENIPDLHAAVTRVKASGLRCGLALSPSTPLTELGRMLDEIDSVLIMTVKPGYVGQPLIEECVRKAELLVNILNERGLSRVEVIVDGGIKLSNVTRIAKTGAHKVVSGTGIFAQPSPANAMREMKRLICQAHSGDWKGDPRKSI